MLPKASRIPRTLFADLRGGRPFHSPHFLLRHLPQGGSVRIGVSVSKKISKRAVVRNRVRRRTYAAISAFIPKLHAGLYVLSAKPGAERLKGEMLKRELAELLKTS